MKPLARPANPCFSSGPCAKRPGWSLEVLHDACLGRSHRSKAGKAKLKEVIDRTRAILGVPADYRIGIVAGSDTGAVELALWSLLGARGVDCLAWESFGEGWITDAVKQLKLKDVRTIRAAYGALPDLTQVDPAHDVVFTWNGTTSGVRVPDGVWIKDDRDGLAICDATSAAFAMEPPWPLPKLFRLNSKGKFNEAIFVGETINTPSMLCLEDAIDGLKWAERVGGLKGLIARSEANLS